MSEIPGILQEKYDRLRGILSEMSGVVVAFSGGVDSTLLLRVALDVLGGDKVLAVSADSPFVPEKEMDWARRIAGEFGAEHRIIELELLDHEKLAHNPPQRCYWCKKILFESIQRIAGEAGYGTVIEGTNHDEAELENRPGLRALDEFGIRSPLREAGLRKQEVRRISQALRLATHDRPSGSCLATRFPHGTELDPDALERVEKAEEVLSGMGFKELRVRSHDSLARIELGRDDLESFVSSMDLWAKVVDELQSLGFVYVTVDLEGYRSGSMEATTTEQKEQNYQSHQA